MQACDSLGGAVCLLAMHGACMDAVHVSMLAGRLAKNRGMLRQLRSADADMLVGLMRGLHAAVRGCAASMRPRHSSSVLWALGKLGAEQPALCCAAPPSTANHHPPHQRLERPQQRGVVVVRASPAARVAAGTADTLLVCLAASMHTASPRDVSQALYGCALLRHTPDPGQLSALLLRAGDTLHTSHTRDLSMLAYALGALGVDPGREWAARFGAASAASLAHASPQSLSNTAWGLAASGCASYLSHTPWPLAFAATSLQAMPFFSHQELCVTAWALSAMGVHPGNEWLAALEDEAASRAHHMNGADISQLLTAVAHWGRPPGAQLSRQGLAALGSTLCSGGGDCRSSGGGRQGTAALWVRGRGGDLPVVTISSLSAGWGAEPAGLADTPAVLSRRLHAQLHLQSAARGPALGPESACSILGALARARAPPRSSDLDAMLDSLAPHLPHLCGGRASSLLHSLAVLQHRPPDRWSARLLSTLRARVSDLSPQQLSSTLWGLARLGLTPDERWMSWLLAEVHAQLGEFGPQSADVHGCMLAYNGRGGGDALLTSAAGAAALGLLLPPPRGGEHFAWARIQ
ncbi:hypothetical protein FOA52_007735 [Chlamydomonas sp. UWO 241]|nr:hypothetical protein FOA52_007735 [Chlamydomonas sp. UWO 241]